MKLFSAEEKTLLRSTDTLGDPPLTMEMKFKVSEQGNYFIHLGFRHKKRVDFLYSDIDLELLEDGRMYLVCDTDQSRIEKTELGTYEPGVECEVKIEVIASRQIRNSEVKIYLNGEHKKTSRNYISLRRRAIPKSWSIMRITVPQNKILWVDYIRISSEVNN